MEGEKPDASASTGKVVTPQKKSRAHDLGKPPDKAIAKNMRGKRVEVRREVAKDLPEIEKGNSICLVCKEDYVPKMLLSHTIVNFIKMSTCTIARNVEKDLC